MRTTIVIGAGLSGLMGALALAEAGLRPLVLAKGQGATHWTAGTIDVWGGDERSPREALQEIGALHPHHPYALIGAHAVEEAIVRFRALTEAARYPYVGGLDRNILLPTSAGALRPAALLPVTMAAGDVRLGGTMLIAGFRELRDFYPPFIAANLSAQGMAARGVYLTIPPAFRRREYNPVTFARLFDDPAFCSDIGRQLRAQRGDATRIGLPAVLGLRDPTGVVAHLQDESGAQIFEIPTLPPSVPGMRLFALFQNAIEQAGGRVQIGSEVICGDGRDRLLTTVWSEAAARRQEHRVERALLATGGVAGGGIRTDHMGMVRETALDLPVRAPANRAAWFAPRFLDPQGHAIYTAGVATDAHLRPIGTDGAVVYDNVTVAGALLAGTDTVRERSRSGVSLATGWAAGRILAEWMA
ncbi:glycerol-3-phosphate dehydrogenase subunit GlpB [Roseiflexus sp.]|uniref:glycerol-3-phosphate dehydrogenase subunit GlpB n=1 Tax=Roseiflexus sp. TaxID=2562120 RepID=UPI0021DC9BAF|nr:glycerol-3-phosphate dehydrogenase subunit GlpB [Roseiflexus sp.]GIW03032.1 MAG: anaerobic glycerol-3-phosphate dehydrogenase subunit B [Roseiflexus sp.]